MGRGVLIMGVGGVGGEVDQNYTTPLRLSSTFSTLLGLPMTSSTPPPWSSSSALTPSARPVSSSMFGPHHTPPPPSSPTPPAHTPPRYILGRGFPGERVGPEPTTDRFHAIMFGQQEGAIPGNALAVAPGTPFSGLKFFGNAFLSRFEGAVLDSPVLRK